MTRATTYLRIVRASAWYDLAVSLPFATPITLVIAWAILGNIQSALGLGPLPVLDVHARLFANFFGTVVTLWAAVRLLRTEAVFGRFDAIGRFAFSLWMVVAIHDGATPLLYGFLLIELTFGIAQMLPIAAHPVRSAVAAQTD